MKHSEPLIMDAMIRLSEQVEKLQRQVDAAKEILDGTFEEDLNSSTGIPLDRCLELLRIIRDE
jgi:hypothetical protein